MVGMGKGWPSRTDWILVLIWIRMWISYSCSLTLGDVHLYTMHCHSLQRLQEIGHYIWYAITYHSATLQQSWQSLHHLSAVVATYHWFFTFVLNCHRWCSWAVHRSSQTVRIWGISSRSQLSLPRRLRWPRQAVIRNNLFTAGIQDQVCRELLPAPRQSWMCQHQSNLWILWWMLVLFCFTMLLLNEVAIFFIRTLDWNF